MAKAPRVPGASDDKAEGAAPLSLTAAPELPADTPNAIDVDPSKLKAPVLTRQGWVCPPEMVRR